MLSKTSWAHNNKYLVSYVQNLALKLQMAHIFKYSCPQVNN